MFKKITITILFFLLSINANATLVEKYFDYETNSTLTALNLNGNLDNIINIINGKLDNQNINTASYRLYELLGSVPAAGTQGRIVFNTVENTLNFDTGAVWYVSPTYTGTASAGEMLYYDGTNWVRTSGITPPIYIKSSDGNVGIGTTAPLGILQVGTSPSPGLLVTKAGNVGIGKTNPTKVLDVTGNIGISGTATLGALSTANIITSSTALVSNLNAEFSDKLDNFHATTDPGVNKIEGLHVFTSNGNFVTPPNITQVYITGTGGGGGGGGGGEADNEGGGGGGAGAAVLKYPFTVIPANTYPVAIGTGGIGGAKGSDATAGNAGGNTTFNTTDIVLLGGNGAGAGSAGVGGSGGVGRGLAVTTTGGSLGFGNSGANYSGGNGGGGGGGLLGSGGNGSTSPSTPGLNATGYGSGGGGGYYDSGGSVNSAGGTGAPGVLIVEW